MANLANVGNLIHRYLVVILPFYNGAFPSSLEIPNKSEVNLKDTLQAEQAAFSMRMANMMSG